MGVGKGDKDPEWSSGRTGTQRRGDNDPGGWGDRELGGLEVRDPERKRSGQRP